MDIARIEVATHIKVAKLKLPYALTDPHQAMYEAVASCIHMCNSHEPSTFPSILSLPTIMGHQQPILLVLTSLHT